MIHTIMSGFIIVVLLVGAMIFSLMMVGRESRTNVFFALFDSRSSNLQLNLYFGFISLFSLFIYTAFSTIINGNTLDIASLGKGVGIIFGGMGISSIGTGLQVKDDCEADQEDDDDDDITEKLAPSTLQSRFFISLFNSKDRDVEMHLFSGALALLGIIFYQGYDLVYISKQFDAEDYGYGLAYAFVGIGAASWSQGVQRKFESKSKPKKKPVKKGSK